MASDMTETEPATPPKHSSMLRKLLGLLHDAMIYGVSGALSQLIGFLLLPLYTRFLTPQDYGIMAMLTIVGSVFEPLARVGITQSVFRFYNLAKTDSERSNVLSTGLISIVTSTVVLLGVFLAVSGPISLWVTGEANTANLLRLTLLTNAIGVINGVPLAALRADRRVKTTSTFNLAKLFISLIFTIWLVVSLQQGIAGVIWGALIAEALSSIGLFALTYRSFPMRFAQDVWRSMIVYGAPFVPHHLLAVGLDLFGIYVVAQKLGIDEAGLYNIAARFVVPLSFTVNSIQQAWTAYKFHRLKHDDDPRPFFGSVVTYYVAGIAYLWLGISLWGPELLRFMTTKDFHAATPLVWTIGLITVGRGLYYMFGTGVEIGGTVKLLPFISLAGLLTVVALSLPLVDLYGARGAAAATATGWAVMAILMYRLARYLYPIQYDWTAIVAFGLLAAAMGLVGGLCREWPLVPRLAGNLSLSLAYPVGAFAILWRSRAERERMAILVGKIRLGRRVPMTTSPRPSSDPR